MLLVLSLFVFHAKSGPTNNLRTRLSNTSYLSPFSLDSNDIKNVPRNSAEKTRFEILVFRLNSIEKRLRKLFQMELFLKTIFGTLAKTVCFFNFLFVILF